MRIRLNEEWVLDPCPSCRCCGKPAAQNLRCAKHQDRQPCAAPGCTRTMAANGRAPSDTAYLCGEHWRLYCPPGGALRRSFNRLVRLARKMGYKRTDLWPHKLEVRWWRLWAGLIRRVHRVDEGSIDEAEIAKLFGWDA